jgi:hypothetical protein
MNDSTRFSQIKPPWIVFPQIVAGELVAYLKQGATEAWFDQAWRPYWVSLDTDEKSAYLRHWNASPEWIDAISHAFDPPDDFDIEADARESHAYLRDPHNRLPKRAWWSRVFGGKW